MINKIKKQKRKELSKITRPQIRKWFDDISSSDITTDRLCYIIDKIVSILGHTTIPIATHRLYRCRPLKKNDPTPGSISSLLQPPIKSTNDGRCNVVGKPVLYVSDHADALVEECNLSVGQHFCLLQFDRLPVVDEDLNCILLGIEPDHALPHESSIMEVKEFWSDFYGKEYVKYREATSCLHKVFVRPNNDDGSMVYKFTSFLCDKYFESINELDAIYYPSVANNGIWRNFAIRPDAINKAYTPSKVTLCELAKDMSFTWVDGAEITPNGDIVWGKKIFLDLPIAVGLSQIDPNDPERYIHPLKDRNE